MAGGSSTENNVSTGGLSDEKSDSDTKDDKQGEKESIDGFTFLNIHDHYSIQLGEGKLPWIAPKRVSSDEFKQCELIEIDLPSFNCE